MARGPARYRDDTRAVLETRNEQIKACYDGRLKSDKDAAGVVVVKFTVQKETGEFTNIELVEDQTTAGERLSACVLEAVQGLKLEPADERDGLATFTWEFKSYDQVKASEDTGA